jgi:membrane-associated phospholipid phosphatase
MTIKIPRGNYFFQLIRIKIFFLVLMINAFHVQAQQDSLPSNHKIKWKKLLLAPTILATAGLVTTIDNNIFDKYTVHEWRNNSVPHFRTNVDDYLQYAPIAVVYALDLFGVKGEHDVLNQTALLVKSELIVALIVFPMKKLTAVPRPDHGELTSFPSGHTAQAFAAATFLHKEYGREHPWYSVLAYTTASGIGVLRILNNRHWLSDVLVGAGVGIFSTNLAYLAHKKKWRRPGRKNRTALLLPGYNNKTASLNFMIKM